MMSSGYPSPDPSPASSPDDALEIQIMEELFNAPPSSPSSSSSSSDEESPVPARKEVCRTRGFNRVQRGDYRRQPRRPPPPPQYRRPQRRRPQYRPPPHPPQQLTPSMFALPTTTTKFLQIKVPTNPAETPAAQRVQGFYVVPESVHDSDFRREWELEDEWEQQLDFLAEVEHVVGSNFLDGRMTTPQDLKNIWGNRSFIKEKYDRTPAP